MSQTWGKLDNRTLGYDYRADGMFLCRAKCADCGEGYDVLALAQATPVDRCPACQQVYDWMTPVQIESKDLQTEIRKDFAFLGAILLATLFSLPFWLLLAYEVKKGIVR